MTAFLAQPLKAPAESLFVVAVALWTGAVVFYSLLVLPTLFASMPSARAGEIAALVFPRYYHGGLLLGTAMLVSAAYLSATTGGSWRWVLLVCVLMLGAQAVSAFGVGPRMAVLRGDETARVEFMHLHRIAMALGTVVMAGGLGLLVSVRRLFGRP